jgi:hypothetical protein
MTFANPSYLWALAGLAIPLAIHLLSRKEGKVIRVGSIRHVEESNTSQFKSIRLNEVLLLLLRSLMVMSLVFFLSGAQCTNPPGRGITWLMIENGIKIDSLESTKYEVHELPAGNYWEVAEQLGKVPHEVVVIAYSKVERFNGERVSLPKNVRWISTEQEPIQFPATAWQAGDSVFVRNASSGPLLTSYRTAFGVPDSIGIIQPKKLVVNVLADDKTEADILIASLNVLKKEYKLPIQISAESAQWTFWLREAKPRFSGDQQVVFSTPGPGPLIERISSNVLHLNRKLDQDVALQENLVIELFKTLYPDLSTPAISKEKDKRSMPDKLAWATGGEKTAADSTPSFAGIEKYLILLFLLSLAAERFVAIRRRQ